MTDQISKTEIHYKRLDYLFEKKVAVYSIAFIAALVLGTILYTEESTIEIAVWLSIYLLLTISRFALTHSYKSMKDKLSPSKWEIIYSVNSAFVGLGWGLASFLILNSQNHSYYYLYVALICGVASGSLVGNGSSRPATLSMIITCLLPPVFYFYFSDLEMGKQIGGLLFLYLGALSIFSRKLNGFINENIELNFENSNLISDLKETSKILVETEKQAVLSSKLAALGEMASGIAHEINNPLTILSGNLRNIDRYIDKPDSKEKVSEMIQKCHLSIQRITKIIRGLKKISRDGSNDDFEQIQISTIVEDIESLIHEKFKTSGVSLNIKNTCPDEYIFCQPIQISQILLNLLNNAFHAIEELPTPWIELKILKSYSNVTFSVIDCGQGISSSAQEQIFTPFFTTKEVGKGTGLGLSISKDIATKHGGELFIDKTSQNTCFTLRLPMQKAMAA